VEIEPGIGGLIAAGDMPGEGDVHPGQIVSISEVVEVEIVEVDLDKRRIYLALRGNQA
jgi:small subunit ribosomal protein S1